MPEPSNCPCCGSDELYTGHLSAMSMGIECHRELGGCGLTMEIYYEDVEHIAGETLKEYENKLLALAIGKWDARIS